MKAVAFAAYCALFFGSLPLAAQTNLGLQHPAIQEVRSLYQETEKAITDGLIKGQERFVEECGPAGETRSIFSEVDGQIRKYVLDAGSDDSKLVMRHYYDGGGTLRFVFVTGGAVNGTTLEHRIYFDENGVRIRDDRKFTAGPGYPFPEFSDAEGLLAIDPGQAFRSGC